MPLRITRCRIQHYRSIVDSGWIRLEDGITVLAGKNESGKSAVLEALRDMDSEVESIAADRIRHGDGEPLIAITLDIPATMLSSVLAQSGCEGFLSRKVVNGYGSSGITLWRLRDGSYELDDGLIERINTKQQHAVKEVKARLRSEWGKLEPPPLPDDAPGEGEDTGAFLAQAQNALTARPADAAKRVKPLVDQLSRLHTRSCVDDLTRRIVSLAPRMMLFSDFDDLLPHQIEITEASANATVADFAKLAGLDLQRLQETSDLQARRNLLGRCSREITGSFKDYWHQDSVCLTAEPDGPFLRLGVKDDPEADLLKVEQRSKGLQWFISFFIRLNAQPSPNSVLLIDEPGLYLHAKAQRDVLHVLEELSKTHQIVFATHSPYLIDTDRLSRIRLVVKGAEGTKVENKFHKLADQDTLTPIITAIGLDVSRALTPGVGRNVVTEGISDYYYLLAMRTVLFDTAEADYSIVPAVGATKVPQIVSLLMGWGLEFAVLLDADSAGRRSRKEQLDGLHLDEARIVTPGNAQAIEDLFTADDFACQVLNLPPPTTAGPNSQRLKDAECSKSLAAKRFLDRVRSGEVGALSEETQSGFRDLLKRLEAAIGPA